MRGGIVGEVEEGVEGVVEEAGTDDAPLRDSGANADGGGLLSTNPDDLRAVGQVAANHVDELRWGA